MSFNQIKESISSTVDFSTADLDLFLSWLEVKNYKKNDIILKEDEICKYIYFVNKGIIRVYYINKSGKEITNHFCIENEYITEYASFLYKRPSHYSMQVLENSELVLMPYEAIQNGYKKIKEGNKFGRLMAERYFIMQADKLEAIYKESIKERYDKMNNRYPHIHQRVPQHMIASYLGISSVHLSRIKSKK